MKFGRHVLRLSGDPRMERAGSPLTVFPVSYRPRLILRAVVATGSCVHVLGWPRPRLRQKTLAVVGDSGSFTEKLPLLYRYTS